MKKTALLSLLSSLLISNAYAQTPFAMADSPDGKTTVYVGSTDGVAWYSIDHGSSLNIPASRLGLRTDTADFTELTYEGAEYDEVGITYQMDRSKTSEICYRANTVTCTFRNKEGRKLLVRFQVSGNDVAFRYILPKEGEQGSARIMEEITEFNFIDKAGDGRISTFLTPQSDAMTGWKRTKPSYEEYYGFDEPAGKASQFGHGYTFPCLFKVGDDGWVLVSETGVDSGYCGSRLSDSRLVSTETGNPDDPDDDRFYYSYRIEYPMPEENNGNGTSEPAIALPGMTPWRTITLGETLHPIVETTVTWDVVEPLYTTHNEYEFGKGTWSWIVWQDESICMKDQKAYIDLSSALGFRYTLIDNWWDKRIGREGIVELAGYAEERKVSLFLWYSSSGWWNDIAQSPLDIMSNPIRRKQEMKWLREIGVKGIKVDFFGGDKQETMRLYEEILADAEEYGLMVIFHGCTLPRGWERMYPNYVGSEAVRASENLVFSQHDCDMEAVYACTHPFIRNAVGCMEFGGCFLNDRLDRTGSKGNIRRTTDVFQLATCILFQNPVQNFAVTPDNLSDSNAVSLDFLRNVPVTWDETRLIDGYPGEFIVLGRRHGDTWYIAAVNARKENLELSIWDLVYGMKDLAENNDSQHARVKPAKDSEVRIINGGNEPLERILRLSDIYKENVSVPKNDGIIITFKVE